MGEARRAALDTNVLVRYLTEDDAAKAQAVERLLNEARAGKVHLMVPPVILAELVWVLESFYKLASRDVADLVEAVLNTPGLHVEDGASVRSALASYRDGKVDFIDALLAEFARAREIEAIYTFDRRHFRDLPGIACRQPA